MVEKIKNIEEMHMYDKYLVARDRKRNIVKAIMEELDRLVKNEDN